MGSGPGRLDFDPDISFAGRPGGRAGGIGQEEGFGFEGADVRKRQGQRPAGGRGRFVAGGGVRDHGHVFPIKSRGRDIVVNGRDQFGAMAGGLAEVRTKVGRTSSRLVGGKDKSEGISGVADQ